MSLCILLDIVVHCHIQKSHKAHHADMDSEGVNAVEIEGREECPVESSAYFSTDTSITNSENDSGRDFTDSSVPSSVDTAEEPRSSFTTQSTVESSVAPEDSHIAACTEDTARLNSRVRIDYRPLLDVYLLAHSGTSEQRLKREYRTSYDGLHMSSLERDTADSTTGGTVNVPCSTNKLLSATEVLGQAIPSQPRVSLLNALSNYYTFADELESEETAETATSSAADAAFTSIHQRQNETQTLYKVLLTDIPAHVDGSDIIKAFRNIGAVVKVQLTPCSSIQDSLSGRSSSAHRGKTSLDHHGAGRQMKSKPVKTTRNKDILKKVKPDGYAFVYFEQMEAYAIAIRDDFRILGECVYERVTD